MTKIYKEYFETITRIVKNHYERIETNLDRSGILGQVVHNTIYVTRDIISAASKVHNNPFGLINKDNIEYCTYPGMKDPVATLYAPDLTLRIGAFMVAIIKIRFLENEEESPLIIYDDTFKRVSEELQRFLLLHEIGHLKYDHLDKIKETKNAKLYNLKRMFGENWIYEFEADAFAADILGPKACIRSLIEMWDCYPIDGALMNHREIKARIEHLKLR